MIHRFAVDVGQTDESLFTSALDNYQPEPDQRHTPIAIHDPENNDVKLARTLADEMINVSGAEVKVYVRTDNADFDAVWDEDPDPTYWSAMDMKAFFKPEPIQLELSKWGADSKNTTEVTFSHKQLYEKLGERMLRTGDVIQLPYNATSALGPKNYRVLNGTPAGNFRYIWLYYTCQVETLTADVTVRPESDDLPMDDEQLRTNGQYREST